MHPLPLPIYPVSNMALTSSIATRTALLRHIPKRLHRGSRNVLDIDVRIWSCGAFEAVDCLSERDGVLDEFALCAYYAE
jgi:hypothetical protein